MKKLICCLFLAIFPVALFADQSPRAAKAPLEPPSGNNVAQWVFSVASWEPSEIATYLDER